MLTKPTDIIYRDFYDIPWMFVTVGGQHAYLFDGSFDESLDDYPDEYAVYQLPLLTADQLAGSWAGLAARAVASLGRVPIEAVRFDPTRREQIDGGVLDRLREASRLVG